MSQNLVQELFKHISILEQQNTNLRQQIYTFNRTKDQICRKTSFDSWEQFIQWIFNRQFQVSNTNNNFVEPTTPRQQMFIQPINSVISFSKDYKLHNFCQYPQEQIRNTEIENKIPKQNYQSDRNRTIKINNKQEILTDKKLKINQQISQLDYIILQNSKLRKKIAQLKQSVQAYKANLYSIIQLLPNAYSKYDIRRTLQLI